MRYRIERTATNVYEADTAELAAEYPEEYAEWVASGGTDDRAWLNECIEAGGFSLFSIRSFDEDWTAERITP